MSADSSQVLMTPPEIFLIRKLMRDSPGTDEKEYERSWPLPGTSILTYWPGRNTGAVASTASSSTTAASLCCSIFDTVAANLLCSVLHAVDDAGTAITQSPCGTIWHVSTRPLFFS